MDAEVKDMKEKCDEEQKQIGRLSDMLDRSASTVKVWDWKYDFENEILMTDYRVYEIKPIMSRHQFERFSLSRASYNSESLISRYEADKTFNMPHSLIM